jgi:pimeloyl-ACP methyl ester carboxylesterase
MISSNSGFRHRQVTVGDTRIHVVEAGDPQARPVVFLHGWPESSRTWEQVMAVAAGAAGQVRAIAIDLPGVGESTGAATDGSKGQLASTVHQFLSAMGLTGVTLVGHDIGGMVVYAYLRRYQDLGRAVIMDVPVPGVPPWEEFVREPYLWHFALHSVADLPERLVQGRQREYFDYFYNVLSADPAKITGAARRAYEAAYATDSALTAGFSWYRAFGRDADDNRRASDGPRVTTPLLYLRGEQERGAEIGVYAEGFRAAGVTHVERGIVAGAGHFTPEEAPEEAWRLIADFAQLDSVPG